jgi:hypothetical protein
VLDSSYNLTDEERGYIRINGLPDPIALGWLQAKRRAEGKPLQNPVDNLSDLFDSLSPNAGGMFGDLFKRKD